MALRDDLVESIGKAVTKAITGIVEEAVDAAITGGKKAKKVEGTWTPSTRGRIPAWVHDETKTKNKAQIVTKYGPLAAFKKGGELPPVKKAPKKKAAKPVEAKSE